jgi:hypothetical protein
LCSLNYGQAVQGGWFAVNSRPKGYPYWEKTSTNAEDQAMFMRMGAQLFEVRFGAADSDPAWEGTHVYEVADKILTTAQRNYECTVGGTSGGTAPSHTTGTATDGGVTWLYLGEAHGINPGASFLGVSATAGVNGQIKISHA